jgi:alpha-L-fucosidase
MRINRRQWMGLAASAAAPGAYGAEWPIAKGPFTPEWDSLKQYQCPEWFRDAKLGIWAVWGPEAVPQVGDWYARKMYIEGGEQYRYHVEHYGHPSKFGYKDIIPLWKAERWEPERLMGLYRKAGAKYFIAIANHHDNFDCWNSKHHRWNSVNFGPKRDVVGTWRKAALAQGLRFGVTEHNARSWSWFNVNKGADKTGPYAGVPYDGNDPKFQDLYFPPHEENGSAYPRNPSDAFVRNWFDRTVDLIDSYQPDLMYYDGGVPFGEVGRRVVAHMYNRSVGNHNGRNEAIFNIKDWHGTFNDHGDYVEGTCVLDVERGVVDRIWPSPWQTDTCIGDWYYKRDIKYQAPPKIIHMLADIASKNGCLLLNIPLRPDGSMDEGEEDFLTGFSAWMAVNGEAIYATRPWRKFGEGPTETMAGGMGERKARPYTAEDLRFTRKGATLYAICLGVPEKELLIRSLAGAKPSRVEMLGLPGALKSAATEAGLVVTLPERKPCRHAVSLRISGLA